jgi:hypothetical protein
LFYISIECFRGLMSMKIRKISKIFYGLGRGSGDHERKMR